MARDRLHIICGNCGCNDMFSWEIVKDSQDFGNRLDDDVYLNCGNCATLHPLSSFIERQEYQKQLVMPSKKRIEDTVVEKTLF